ncbi:MAG TPA: heparan-alpha-glucosaminide N-acetyltransferase domain-containing protein [Polyangiales bacterium]
MATKQERQVFVDALRLIAAVQMIQGHAVSAVLAPSYKSGWLFDAWSFARGLTSVMFLFSAGYAFAWIDAREETGRRVRRALTLIALGYLMHAPFAIVLGAPREAALQSAVVVDVLQCIGVSLLSLEGLRHWWPRQWLRVAFTSTAALAVFGLAPLTAAISVEGGLRPLANYVTAQGGSLFPLVPWLGYVYAGYSLGAFARRRPTQTPRLLAAASAASFALGAAWLRAGPAVPRSLSPGYGVVKLACVLALAALLAWWLRGRRLPGLLSRLSRETLFLYLSHVVILYADRIGLQERWRGQGSPWFGVWLALVLMVGCSAAALAWRGLREGGTKAPPER